MNKQRRKEIEKVMVALSVLQGDVERMMDEECEYRDNMPENLQYSERYELADMACDNLDEAIRAIEEAVEYLNEATN